MLVKQLIGVIVACLVVLTPALASAAPPGVVDEDTTRYLAMGDSVPAGQGAVPQTQGYVYRLYKRGVFDRVPNTIMSNAGLGGGVLSADVLALQVPAAEIFEPYFVTLDVGGNDLATVLLGAPFLIVLSQFEGNLTDILTALCGLDPQPSIFVANQYAIPEIIALIPNGEALFSLFNSTYELVVDAFATAGCDVHLVDVFAAFGGFDVRPGLLLIDRQGAGPTEVHPTNAGHGVIADAFAKVIDSR